MNQEVPMRAMFVLIPLFVAGCAGDFETMCDDVSALPDQQACVSDAEDLAREDVDRRVADETDRVRDERIRRGLEERGTTCREEISDLAESIRIALARNERRAERRMTLRRGL